MLASLSPGIGVKSRCIFGMITGVRSCERHARLAGRSEPVSGSPFSGGNITSCSGENKIFLLVIVTESLVAVGVASRGEESDNDPLR